MFGESPQALSRKYNKRDQSHLELFHRPPTQIIV
jgi:hypothetical protein